MTDFIVIGGGIAGISAAARLSHLGKVTVLEAESGLGFHTSGRSAAMFDRLYGHPTTMVMNHASADYHMNANGGILTPLGMLLIATDVDDTAEYETDRDRMSMDELTFDEAQKIVPILNPDTVTRTAINNDVWNIDTDRLIQNFAREVRANGGQVLTDQRVKSITRTKTGWSVETKDGNFEAAKLVNAAGSWVDEIAALAGIKQIGFVPYRRSMARIPAPGGHDVSNWPMLHGVNTAWYARRDAGEFIISPAEAHATTPHDAWADDMVLAEGIERYQAVVTEPVTKLTSSWAGLRTFSPDKCLVLGPDVMDPDFIWVAGQGGVGFQTCPAASQLVADLVNGSTPELDADIVAALSPDRYS